MAPKKLKTMLMQNFGVTIKEHYGMLRYFLEWSILWFKNISSEIFWYRPLNSNKWKRGWS